MIRPSHIVLSLALLLTCCVTGFAQPSPSAVNQADGPPSGPSIQTVFVYSGSNVIATCWSPSSPTTLLPRTATVAISAVSKASAAVVTSTGHGFTLLTRPQVTISGATGTGWSAINATHVATVIDANTFSIPIASTGFGTLAGTVVFTTPAPRQTVAEWSVQILLSGASPPVTGKAWLNGSQAYGSKCSDATSTTAVLQ